MSAPSILPRVRTRGAELPAHVDVYGLVPLLRGQRGRSDAEKGVGLVAGVHGEDGLPVLRVQGGVAWARHTWTGVSGTSTSQLRRFRRL